MNKRTTNDDWKKIDAIFQEVVELKGQTRDARIEQLTAGNAQLKQEVLSLLSFDRGSGDPAMNILSIAHGQAVSQNSRRKVGDQIDGYRLIFPVSINATSEVWCAETSKNGEEERVAIKFLCQKLDAEQSKSQLLRFANEAHLMSQFRHPNIASLIEVGQDEFGSPFIVMGFVDGQPITEYADSQRLSLNERTTLLLKVCEAIGYAHRFLIVHRDLKPSNILVNKEGEPILLDFGISKRLQSDDDQATATKPSLTLTTTAERPMTPAYASPEQVRGDTITTATDIHGFGLILFEVLSGHHPFSETCHPNVRHLFDRICASAPLLPSEVVSKQVQPLERTTSEKPNSPQMIAALRSATTPKLKKQLTKGLDHIVAKAIAKAPAERYESMADVRNDLLNFLENRAISAKPYRTDLPSLVRRRPLTSMVSAAGVAAILATGVTGFIGFQQLQHSREQLAQSNVEISATQRQLELANQALNDSKSDRVKFENSVAKALGKNVENGDATQPSNLILQPALIRKAAATGRFENAIDLLDELKNANSLPLNNRLELAEAHYYLGTPTAGLQLIEDLVSSPSPRRLLRDLENPVLAQQTVMRLLLLAGRINEASSWSEISYGPEVDLEQAGHLLTVGHCRSAIGWGDGAKEIVQLVSQRWQTHGIAPEAKVAFDALKVRVGQMSADSALNENKAGNQIESLSRCRLLVQGFSKDAESKNWELAEERANETLDVTTTAGLPNHLYAIKACSTMSDVYAARNDDIKSQEWNERGWQKLLASNEFGTETAVWLAIDRMQEFKNASDIDNVLERLKLFAKAYESDPYRERWIRILAFRSAELKQDWQSAKTNLERLSVLEPKLWGENSLENGFALAAQIHALNKLGSNDKSAAKLPKLNSIIDQLTEKLPKVPVHAFLTAARNLDSTSNGISKHQLIRFYQMLSRNPVDDQLEFIVYQLEQAVQNDPECSEALIEPAIELFKTNIGQSNRKEAFRLRFGMVAVDLERIEMVRGELKSLLTSTNRQTIDQAATALVLGLTQKGLWQDAFEVAKTAIEKIEFDGSDLQQQIRTTVESAPASESEQWQGLFE